MYSTIKDYETEEKNLRDRYQSAITIAGTQKFHAFKPVGDISLEVKHFSPSSEAEVKKVCDFWIPM